jgi:hypothetical protein
MHARRAYKQDENRLMQAKALLLMQVTKYYNYLNRSQWEVKLTPQQISSVPSSLGQVVGRG